MGVQSKPKATGGVTGKGFQPGRSGNPGGRRPIPLELKEALAADTLPRYERLKALAKKAEKAKDFKTAAHIELALFKKTVPDATELVVSVPEGLTVRSMRVDPRELSQEELAVLIAVQKRQAK